jgi:osmotically-inducible protein OsmY
MIMSGVKPAEHRRRFFAWGLILLGPAAFLASPSLLQGSGVWAQQRPAVSGASTAAVGDPAKSQAAYKIQVIKQAGDKLKLRGLVTSAEDHKALLGLVKASFPSADVYDRVKIDDSSKADGAKTDMKLGSVSFALKALSYLQSGSAKIDEQSIALFGNAETRAVYTEVRNLIDSGRPTGITVQENINKPASFAWSAEASDGKVRLAGAVPDAAAKKQLEATVQRQFTDVELVDNTYISEGVPENWLEAAIHSLKVLCLLNSGAVVVADHSIQLNGHASDEKALQRIDQLADKYPAGFALESKVSVPPAQASMFDLGYPHSAAFQHDATEGSPDAK